MSGTMDHVTLTVKVDSKALKTGNLGITADDPLLRDYTQLLANGTGANQASNHWHDQRTIAASGNDDLDISGVLTNVFGTSMVFTKIKALIVKAAGNTNDVIVGGAASNQFATFLGAATHTIKVKPGGLLVLVAPDANGYAVTAGTGDILRITNGGAGTSVTYDIVLIGVD
jgi:hypothetical protein